MLVSELEITAKNIAENMKRQGMYSWQVDNEVENKNLPITYTEKIQLIEMVKGYINRQ